MLPFIVINDDVIRDRLLSSAEMISRFPKINDFRNRMVTLDKECFTCSGKADAIRKLRELMQEIRKWVADLPDHDKKFVREVLKVPADRFAMVSWYSGAGRQDRKLEKLNF